MPEPTLHHVYTAPFVVHLAESPPHLPETPVCVSKQAVTCCYCGKTWVLMDRVCGPGRDASLWILWHDERTDMRACPERKRLADYAHAPRVRSGNPLVDPTPTLLDASEGA